MDIIFAGEEFRAKSKFANIAKISSTRKIGVIQYFIPLVVVMSVVQVFLGLPRDILPCIFPSISCSCDELCLIL